MIEIGRSYSQKLLENYQVELQSAIESTFKIQRENILKAGNILREALENGQQVLLMGNGGSSSQCNHAEAEYYYWRERKAPPSIKGSMRSLTANPDALTAFANDYGGEELFSIQLKSISKSGDIVLVISTSGMSKNICNALKTADLIGLTKIGLLGGDGGKAASYLDINIIVEQTTDTNIIQDIQSSICHILLQLAVA